jgi:hypothetical protein
LDVPRRDIERNFQDTSADYHSSTYLVSGVGVKGRTMDDKSSIINVDRPSLLKVVCPTPEIGAESSRKFLRTAIELLTAGAVLLRKVLSWISTLAPSA